MEPFIAAEMIEVQNPMKALNSLINRAVLSETVSDEVIAADTTKYRNPLDRVCFEMRNSCLTDTWVSTRSSDGSQDDSILVEDYSSSPRTILGPSGMTKFPKDLFVTADVYGTAKHESVSHLDQTAKVLSDNRDTKDETDSSVSYTSRNHSVKSERSTSPSEKTTNPAKTQESSRFQNHLAKAPPLVRTQSKTCVLQDSHITNSGKKDAREGEVANKNSEVRKQISSTREQKLSLIKKHDERTLAVGKRSLHVTKSNEENRGETKATPDIGRSVLKTLLRSPFTKRQRGITNTSNGGDPVSK